jgi:cell division septation protein DedD
MSEKGFTYVDFLIAIVASLFALGAIVATFIIIDNRDAQIAGMQKNVRTGMEGYKERQELAPPKRLAEVRKRTEAPQPLTIQAAKPIDQEAAAPFTEEGPPKTEPPELSLLELVELKPPAAGKAPTLEVTVEPEEVIEEPDKQAEIVAGASSERPSAPEMPPGGTFTINLSSFRQKQRADRYVEELKKLGLFTYCWKVNLPEKGRWYRVSVGGFPTLKEAKNYTKQLRQEGISDWFIIEITESSNMVDRGLPLLSGR